jgi:hypothetical protein
MSYPNDDWRAVCADYRARIRALEHSLDLSEKREAALAEALSNARLVLHKLRLGDVSPEAIRDAEQAAWSALFPGAGK